MGKVVTHSTYKKCEQCERFIVVRLHSTLLKYITMIITSKITGRNISTEYLALMSGLITNDEFELITLTIK